MPLSRRHLDRDRYGIRLALIARLARWGESVGLLDFELAVSYVGEDPDGQVFEATVFGTAEMD